MVITSFIFDGKLIIPVLYDPCRCYCFLGKKGSLRRVVFRIVYLWTSFQTDRTMRATRAFLLLISLSSPPLYPLHLNPSFFCRSLYCGLIIGFIMILSSEPRVALALAALDLREKERVSLLLCVIHLFFFIFSFLFFF